MSGRRVPSIYTNSIYSRPSNDSSARNVPEQSRAHLQQPGNNSQRGRTESATSVYSRASNQSQQSGTQQNAAPVASPQSAQPPARVAPPPPSIATSPASNTLLLTISGPPDVNLKSYVQTALGRARSISDVAILGSQSEEQALKQLKVDMYAIAGSMDRSLGVQMLLLPEWRPEDLHRGIGELLGQVKKSNGVGAMAEKWGGGGPGAAAGDKMKAVRGLILDMPRPRDGLAEADGSAVELLDLDTAEFQESWKQTVGFLHAFARETVPLLRLSAHQKGQASEISLQNPFFVLTMRSKSSGVASLNESTLRALLENLSSSAGNRDIIFGHADQLLIPDPEPVDDGSGAVVAPTNGWNDSSTDSPGGESPTKLWGMWSMQNELSSFD